MNKKIPKSKLHAYDHTFLYGQIYNALVDMEPYITSKQVRKFRTAMFLAKRLHDDKFFPWIRRHGYKCVRRYGNQFVHVLDPIKRESDVQTLHLELLMKIIARHSREWWN